MFLGLGLIRTHLCTLAHVVQCEFGKSNWQKTTKSSAEVIKSNGQLVKSNVKVIGPNTNIPKPNVGCVISKCQKHWMKKKKVLPNFFDFAQLEQNFVFSHVNI